MKKLLCEKTDWLFSEEAFLLYAPCMYRPSFDRYTAKMRAFADDARVKVFLCRDGEKTEGMLVLDASGDIPEIAGIAVSADRRLRGIGRFLIENAVEKEKIESMKAETDESAVGFYRALGFSARKEIREYPEGTGVRYVCTLAR